MLALGSATSIANVGLKDCRQLIEFAGIIRATLDGHGRTVHVHLPIADKIEPGPSNDRVTTRGRGRDREVVFLCNGTAADHGLDNPEGLATVVTERHLTRATAMGSAAFERHARGLTSLVGCNGSKGVVVVVLAREIGT